MLCRVLRGVSATVNGLRPIWPLCAWKFQQLCLDLVQALTAAV